MRNDIIWIFLHLWKTGGTTFSAHLSKHLKWDEEFINLSPWGAYSRKKNKRPKFFYRKLSERKKVKVIGGHYTFYGIHKWVPNKKPRYITFLRCPAQRLVSQFNGIISMGEGGTKISGDITFEQWYTPRMRNEMTYFYCRRLPPMLQTLRITQILISRLKSISLVRKLKQKAEDNLCLNSKHLDKAKSLLRRCWFVGLTEELDYDLAFLFNEIGVPKGWKNYRVADDGKNTMEDIIDHPTYLRSGGKTHKRVFVLDEETKRRIYEENELDVTLYNYAKELHKQKTN